MMVVSVIDVVPDRLKMAPPSKLELPWNVEPVTVSVPPWLSMAPPSP